MLYMFYAIAIQSEVTQNLIYNIKILYYETKTKLKEDMNLKKIYKRELLDYMFRDPIYTRITYARHLSVGERTAATHLKLLETK